MVWDESREIGYTWGFNVEIKFKSDKIVGHVRKSSIICNILGVTASIDKVFQIQQHTKLYELHVNGISPTIFNEKKIELMKSAQNGAKHHQPILQSKQVKSSHIKILELLE